MGTDYRTEDGTAIRDYIHVSDLAIAHVKAVEYLLSGGKSGPFNLGTGRGHSVRDVVAAVKRVGRRPVPMIESPRRAGDPPALVADSRRARTVLGWKPCCTDLDEIVRSAWKWHASHVHRSVAR